MPGLKGFSQREPGPIYLHIPIRQRENGRSPPRYLFLSAVAGFIGSPESPRPNCLGSPIFWSPGDELLLGGAAASRYTGRAEARSWAEGQEATPTRLRASLSNMVVFHHFRSRPSLPAARFSVFFAHQTLPLRQTRGSRDLSHCTQPAREPINAT